MKRTRLWLILGGLLVVVVVLSIVMQAINSLIWQLSYWLPGWLVGPILLLLVGALVLALLPLVEPLIRGKRGQTKPGQPTPPSNRQEAARRNLDSIDQQLAQLSDDVARRALQQQRQQVQESLERGDFRVVVFGSGSSGKTSLIRALLNDQVGAVGAAMGSTTSTNSYRLRLAGLGRSIQLRDTPGILEAGEQGSNRERDARSEAVLADRWNQGCGGPLPGGCSGVRVALGWLARACRGLMAPPGAARPTPRHQPAATGSAPRAIPEASSSTAKSGC